MNQKKPSAASQKLPAEGACGYKTPLPQYHYYNYRKKPGFVLEIIGLALVIVPDKALKTLILTVCAGHGGDDQVSLSDSPLVSGI